jgi:hypothetical protein
MIVDVFRELLRVKDQEFQDTLRRMRVDERDSIKGLPKYSSQTEVLENIIRIKGTELPEPYPYIIYDGAESVTPHER